jgi:hypothetical protein
MHRMERWGGWAGYIGMSMGVGIVEIFPMQQGKSEEAAAQLRYVSTQIWVLLLAVCSLNFSCVPGLGVPVFVSAHILPYMCV